MLVGSETTTFSSESRTVQYSSLASRPPWNQESDSMISGTSVHLKDTLTHDQLKRNTSFLLLVQVGIVGK